MQNKTTFNKYANIDRYYEKDDENYQDDVPYDLYNMVTVVKKNVKMNLPDLKNIRKVLKEKYGNHEKYSRVLPKIKVSGSGCSTTKNAAKYHNKWYVPFDMRFKPEAKLSKSPKQVKIESYKIDNKKNINR